MLYTFVNADMSISLASIRLSRLHHYKFRYFWQYCWLVFRSIDSTASEVQHSRFSSISSSHFDIIALLPPTTSALPQCWKCSLPQPPGVNRCGWLNSCLLEVRMALSYFIHSTHFSLANSSYTVNYWTYTSLQFVAKRLLVIYLGYSVKSAAPLYYTLCTNWFSSETQNERDRRR